MFACLCFCFLAKEADGSNLEAKLLVGVAEVRHHEVDDGNLVDLGSVDFQHGLSIALPRLQGQSKEPTRGLRDMNIIGHQK